MRVEPLGETCCRVRKREMGRFFQANRSDSDSDTSASGASSSELSLGPRPNAQWNAPLP
ncbi:MAG: hypothetical protein R3E97_11550 [Candidatus Eisenbacteria bacterium]